MLVFFDETFRRSQAPHGKTLGALCGIAIPERELARISSDVFQLKRKHFDAQIAANSEMKATGLFSNAMFRLESNKKTSNNLDYARDLAEYIAVKQFRIFGCVCFDKEMQQFRCEDVRSLDNTFKYVFERLDMFMKVKHPGKLAKIVFDDRDFGTNQKNAHAITNFFQLSAVGLSLDSILPTPFFAISQSQNVGLHLADFITAIIGMRFAKDPRADFFYEKIKGCRFVYEDGERTIYSLKVIHE